MTRGGLMAATVLLAGCATPRPATVAETASGELRGCHRVDASVAGGLRTVGRPLEAVPELFRDGTVYCLDERGVQVRDPWGGWRRRDAPWRVEPVFGGTPSVLVGEIWSFQPEPQPEPSPEAESLPSLCSIDPASCPHLDLVPPLTLRFVRIGEELRVEDGPVSVGLAPLEEDELEDVRRGRPATRLLLRPGVSAEEPAAEDEERPREIDLAPSAEADDGTAPRKERPLCTEEQEPVLDGCLAYCPEDLAGGAATSGALTANSIPQSWVLVDGCLVGMTPVLAHPVTPGRHVVTFLHEELGKVRRSVVVDADEIQTVAVKLTR